VSVVFLASCQCGPVGGVPDANGTIDAGLPVVTPGRRCPDLPHVPGTGCVEGGWFVLSPWSNFRHIPYGWGFGEEHEPGVPVYLDTFLLDETEVTNAAFAQAGRAVPSDCAGWQYLEIGEEPPTFKAQRSGWSDAGSFDADAGWADKPVVCVTRVEAQRYCEERGGRLPTSFEFMRAARSLAPDTRRYPWGDDQLDPTSFARSSSLHALLALDTERTVLPGLRPVREAVDGRSAAGLFGVAANASEFVHECAEELDARDFTAPLVRPARQPFAVTCRRALAAGSHWDAFTEFGFAGTMTLFTLETGSQTRISYLGANPAARARADDDWAGLRAGPSANTDLVSFRAWVLGFRCAYDVAP
jgi:formylglycine-generating enzyme required for sulfatase activity